jgi:hypothetical protein
MVMGPTGLGTKNYYAGEGQQQFTWLTSHLAQVPGIGEAVNIVIYNLKTYKSEQDWEFCLVELLTY